MRMQKWCFQRRWGAICVTVSWETFRLKSFLILSVEKHSNPCYYIYIYIYYYFLFVLGLIPFHRGLVFSIWFMPLIYTLNSWNLNDLITWHRRFVAWTWIFVGGCPDRRTWNTNYTPDRLTWNLKIPPLEKEKHRPKPPIFGVPW